MGKRKRMTTKGKCKNAYVPTYFIRVVDKYTPKLKKTISKDTKMQITKPVVMEILAKIIEKEPSLLDRHKKLIKSYVGGK